MRMPKAGTIITAIVISLAAIWLANNVRAIGNLVGPRTP